MGADEFRPRSGTVRTHEKAVLPRPDWQSPPGVSLGEKAAAPPLPPGFPPGTVQLCIAGSDRVMRLRFSGVRAMGVYDVGVIYDFHAGPAMIRDPEGMLSKSEGEFSTAIGTWS